LEQALNRTCGPMERGAHAGAGLLAGLVTPWAGPTLEQPVPEGLNPVGRTHIGEVCGGLSPVRGNFMLKQGKSVRSPPPEEEGAAETMCDELTAASIPSPPVPLGEKR